MFHKILVPLDSTPASEHALPWALALADREEASLTLVQVHPPITPAFSGIEMTADLTIDQTLRHQERERLSALAGRLSADGKRAVSWEVLEGTVAEQVRDYAVGGNFDLVVMTTHARGPFVRFLLGSVTDKLVRKLEKPILLVRPTSEETADLTARPQLKRIWVPLDGSPLAEQVLGAAEELARLMGARITLLSVAEGDTPETAKLFGHLPPVPEYVEPNATEMPARQYLEAVAGRLRGKVPNIDIRIVVKRPVVAGIIEQLGDPHTELIALSTHGRGGLLRVLLGSTADEVLRKAHCPILLYRSH